MIVDLNSEITPESIGCDGSVLWKSLGQMLENHATALREIVDSLPDALNDDDATSKTLAIHAWLCLMDHPQVSLLQCPAFTDLGKTKGRLAVCVIGHDHYDGRTLTRREILAGPLSHTSSNILEWPTMSNEYVERRNKIEKTQHPNSPWMTLLAVAEQAWFERHPQALTARFHAGAVDVIRDDDESRLVFLDHTWEAASTYMKLPALLRANLNASNANFNADPLHRGLSPKDIRMILDGLEGHDKMPWLERATFNVVLHPPTAERLAHINARKLDAQTYGLDHARRGARL